jgi:hypothetical protein
MKIIISNSIKLNNNAVETLNFTLFFFLKLNLKFCLNLYLSIWINSLFENEINQILKKNNLKFLIF